MHIHHTPSIKQMLCFCLLTFFAVIMGCNQKNKDENTKDIVPKELALPKKSSPANTFKTNIVTKIGSNILSIFQDSNNNYWFGTQSMGVYRYDGKVLLQFTDKDGLYNNQVQTIQEDQSGNIWFGTGAFGVSRFDGQTFTTFHSKENSDKNWNIKPDDLWFNAGGGVYHYSNNLLSYLPLAKAVANLRHSQNPSNQLNSYGVYSILKDKKGNLWFGTQNMGVAKYDGNSFSWFTERGLAGPAVLALFEDRNGTMWFGNNGSGLFKYDGISLTNFTEEHRLGNKEFFKTSKVSAKLDNTLARIYTINEDYNGILWIGTVDAGVWRYDGQKLIQYTVKDGLTSNAVTTIYKDKRGELWFGTEGNGICKFNGTSFTAFTF